LSESDNEKLGATVAVWENLMKMMNIDPGLQDEECCAEHDYKDEDECSDMELLDFSPRSYSRMHLVKDAQKKKQTEMKGIQNIVNVILHQTNSSF